MSTDRKNADPSADVQSEETQHGHEPTSSETPMRQFTVDLDRLQDDGYMEVLTASEGWAQLEQFFRASLILGFLDQLKRSGAPDQVRDTVIKTFLRNLSPDEMASLRSQIETSDFLDALVTSLGDKPT